MDRPPAKEKGFSLPIDSRFWAVSGMPAQSAHTNDRPEREGLRIGSAFFNLVKDGK